jgi:hypothetical protein
MSTAMFNSSRRTKKATANDGGAVEQHRSDERVSEVQQSASRSGFSFVEVEFPTLDHRKGSLKNTTTAVENDDGGPMAREKATTLEAKTSSHGSSNNRVQFSVVVAGRRRASSSELEGGPTPPVSSSNKQILKAADTKSYAQSLLAPQK